MSKFAALQLEVDKPSRMEVLDPRTNQPYRAKDGSGRTAYVDVYSSDSNIARKHNMAIQRRRIAMRGRVKITPEELEAEAVELLVALTAGWLLIAPNGEVIDLPFTAENAREVYSDRSMLWLRNAVDEFSSDRANFSQASSTS